MGTYPDLGVVLVGDCGERDPEIYRQVVLRHPGRVFAVYVRDVAPERHDAVRAISEELAGHASTWCSRPTPRRPVGTPSTTA